MAQWDFEVLFDLLNSLSFDCILQAIFDMIDTDGNGFIDFVDYMVAISANRSEENTKNDE